MLPKRGPDDPFPSVSPLDWPASSWADPEPWQPVHGPLPPLVPIGDLDQVDVPSRVRAVVFLDPMEEFFELLEPVPVRRVRYSTISDIA